VGGVTRVVSEDDEGGSGDAASDGAAAGAAESPDGAGEDTN
jgi:hypothetical protein